MLESVDEHLLRSLVKAHSKTPLEFLYLEAGEVPKVKYLNEKNTHSKVSSLNYDELKIQGYLNVL